MLAGKKLNGLKVTNQAIGEWLLDSLTRYTSRISDLQGNVNYIQAQNALCEKRLIEFNNFAKKLNSAFDTNGFKFTRTGKSTAIFKFNDYEICKLNHIDKVTAYNTFSGLYSEDFTNSVIEFLLTFFPDKMNLINILK
jgi:hypothetical protein